MASQYTAPSDVQIPENFREYVIQRTMEKSAFFQSGVVQPLAGLSIGSAGGSQVQMPYWEDLDGDDQVLDSNTNLEVRKVTSERDVAVLHGRALVYGANDLAQAFAGSDPLAAAADLIAAKWNRVMQKILLANLNGAMGALGDLSGSPNVLDISALSGSAAVIDGASFIDANQKLGDAKDQLAAVAMHSATNTALAKQGLIDTVRDADGRVLYTTFMGKRVIVDDGLPATAGVYTTYLFGAGAVGYGEGAVKVPFEFGRDPLINGGQDYFVSRRHFVLHTRGIKWDPISGVPAKDTPSNTEIANKANYTPVYEPKAIRVVKFVHKIA